jgi:hypothetical protein
LVVVLSAYERMAVSVWVSSMRVTPRGELHLLASGVAATDIEILKNQGRHASSNFPREIYAAASEEPYRAMGLELARRAEGS